MEYYAAMNRDAFESVLTRWMNSEPIIQSEVSQKKKNNYHKRMHIYGIYIFIYVDLYIKMVLMNLFAG